MFGENFSSENPPHLNSSLKKALDHFVRKMRTFEFKKKKYAEWVENSFFLIFFWFGQ